VRKNIVALVAVGTLGLSGFALAGPAMAAVGASSETTAAARAPVDRIKSALSGLVSDKTLTQAQADKVATTLESSGLGRGGPGGHGGPGGFGGFGGPGGRGGFGAGVSEAAKALGMTEAELRTAIESGKSLADVAKDKSVSVDTVVAALVKAAKERLAEAVKDGHLTQAQADERVADLTTRITERVNSTLPLRPNGSAPSK
jgi:hypothetical protein